MPAPTINQLIDLARQTIPEYNEQQYVDLTDTLQKYYALPMILNKTRRRVGSGTSFTWAAITNDRSNGGYSKLYDTDDYNRYEGTERASVGWSIQKFSWTIDEREVELNSGSAQLINLMKLERWKCLKNQAKFYEQAVWSRPTPAGGVDPDPILGIPYYVTKAGDTTNAGFYGGVLQGWGTTIANLNPSLIPGWNNYAGLYTTVNRADLIAKIRTALDLCNFEPPVPRIPGAMNRDRPRHTIYVNQRTYQAMEDLAFDQNQGGLRGTDLANYDGQVTIRKIPVVYVPYLDLDDTDPVYGIDWDSFSWITKGPWWMKESKIGRHPRSHNVMAGFFDSIANLVCHDRRANFVFAKSTDYPI